MLSWAGFSLVLPRVRRYLRGLPGPGNSAGCRMIDAPAEGGIGQPPLPGGGVEQIFPSGGRGGTGDIVPHPGRWERAPERRSNRRGRPLTYSGGLRQGTG